LKRLKKQKNLLRTGGSKLHEIKLF